MKKYLFAISLIYSQLAFSQNDLKSLIQQTLTSHPKLKEQQQAVKISEYRNKLSQSQYLPNINAEATYTYVDPVAQAIIASPLGENKIQFQPNHNFGTALTINQLIYDFGKTSASIHKSKLEAETATQGLASGQNALAYQVAALYYSIIFTQKAIEVQKAHVNLLADNEQLIADKIKDGDEIEYNLVATQVRRKNAEIRLADLENQKQKQLILLKSLTAKTDLQIDNTTNFQANLPEIKPSEGSGNNYDLKIAKLREETALQDLKIAQRGRLPYLGWQGSIGYKNGIQPQIYDFRFNYLIGARLTVPIFTGFRNQYQTQIGQESYQMLKYATDNQTLIVNTGLAQAENDYLTAQDKLARSEAQVKQAEYALELADTRYQNGIITNLDVLTAQTALQEAKLNKLQYEYQTLVAKLEWHRWAGTKLWE